MHIVSQSNARVTCHALSTFGHCSKARRSIRLRDNGQVLRSDAAVFDAPPEHGRHPPHLASVALGQHIGILATPLHKLPWFNSRRVSRLQILRRSRGRDVVVDRLAGRLCIQRSTAEAINDTMTTLAKSRKGMWVLVVGRGACIRGAVSVLPSMLGLAPGFAGHEDLIKHRAQRELGGRGNGPFQGGLGLVNADIIIFWRIQISQTQRLHRVPQKVDAEWYVDPLQLLIIPSDLRDRRTKCSTT